jgi:hypothetical protein
MVDEGSSSDSRPSKRSRGDEVGTWTAAWNQWELDTASKIDFTALVKHGFLDYVVKAFTTGNLDVGAINARIKSFRAQIADRTKSIKSSSEKSGLIHTHNMLLQLTKVLKDLTASTANNAAANAATNNTANAAENRAQKQKINALTQELKDLREKYAAVLKPVAVDGHSHETDDQATIKQLKVQVAELQMKDYDSMKDQLKVARARIVELEEQVKACNSLTETFKSLSGKIDTLATDLSGKMNTLGTDLSGQMETVTREQNMHKEMLSQVKELSENYVPSHDEYGNPVSIRSKIDNIHELARGSATDMGDVQICMTALSKKLDLLSIASSGSGNDTSSNVQSSLPNGCKQICKTCKLPIVPKAAAVKNGLPQTHCMIPSSRESNTISNRVCMYDLNTRRQLVYENGDLCSSLAVAIEYNDTTGHLALV